MLTMAVLVAIVLLAKAAAAAPSTTPLYKTPGAPVDERVACGIFHAARRPCCAQPDVSHAVVCRCSDLVKRMNMDEKVNQLVLPFGAHFPDDYKSFNRTGLGGDRFSAFNDFNELLMFFFRPWKWRLRPPTHPLVGYQNSG